MSLPWWTVPWYWKPEETLSTVSWFCPSVLSQKSTQDTFLSDYINELLGSLFEPVGRYSLVLHNINPGQEVTPQ